MRVLTITLAFLALVGCQEAPNPGAPQAPVDPGGGQASVDGGSSDDADASAVEEASSVEASVSLRSRAAALLASRCGECHDDAGSAAGLRLTSLDGLVDGRLINLRRPSRSLILDRVSRPEGDGERMPMMGAPLTVDEVGVLRDWIEAEAAQTTPSRSLISDAQMIEWALADGRRLLEEPGGEALPAPPGAPPFSWSYRSRDRAFDRRSGAPPETSCGAPARTPP